MKNNDIFSFTINLVMDGVKKTIKEYNDKYDTDIDETLFISNIYKNVYSIGNQEMEELDKRKDKDVESITHHLESNDS